VGTCTTSLNISVGGITTSTTTIAPASFTLGHDNLNFFTACTRYTSSPQTLYSTNGSTLIIGTTLYDNQSLTIVASDGFYSNGTTWWRVTGTLGVITSTGSCATTTTTTSTTTAAPTTTTTSTTTEAPSTTTTSTTTEGVAVFSLGYHETVGWQSCYTTRTNYYSYAGDIVQNGTYLFTDITLSTKAPVGYYSDGANYYYIASTCNEYTFTNTLGYDESVEYYDCSGTPQTLLVYDGTTSSAVCVDSIINLNGLTANNNGLGSCTPNSIGILQDATPCPTTSTTSTTSTSTSTTSTSTTSTSTSTTSTSTSTTSTSTTTTEAPTTTTTTAAGTTTTTTLAPGETSTTTTSTTAAPTTTTTQPPTTTTTTTQPPTTTTTTTQPPTTTTTTTTSAPVSAPTVDTCSGQTNLAIFNSATGVSLGYTDPVGPGGNLLFVCTIGGSPLATGNSDSWIGVFAPSYSTQLSGANGKQLRTWVNGTLFSTINITSSPITVSGDASFGGGDLVILEVVD
jgi:hypothetical protein